ncbi:MAG: ArsA family ATPase [Prochlorotrichaceae cyanobacterium]
MTPILTLLGQDTLRNQILSSAMARRSAAQGQKVLLLSPDQSPALDLLFATAVTGEQREVESHLWVQRLQSTQLLERSWEDLKKLEAQYLRTPFLKSVYGQELSILPGMDSALALNQLREEVTKGQWDLVIFAGTHSVETLRMLGMPEVMSWYLRRFRSVFLDSDVAKAALPFLQPLVAAVSTVNWSEALLTEPDNQMTNLLTQGSTAVSNPQQVLAYLTTGNDSFSSATAQSLWGMAQQVGLTIAGVLSYPATAAAQLQENFAPLTVSPIPLDNLEAIDWAALSAALPPLDQGLSAPRALSIDIAQRQVRVFLPGFDKKQVKLTQYGGELTIEAGDQRRNIDLPPELSGKAVAGAKFQDHYLIVTIAA